MRKEVCVGLCSEQTKAVQTFSGKNELSWSASSHKNWLHVKFLAMKKLQQIPFRCDTCSCLWKSLPYFLRRNARDNNWTFKVFKFFKQIPHNLCVCEYHENIFLILSILENHTGLSSKFNHFVKQVTCNESEIAFTYIVIIVEGYFKLSGCHLNRQKCQKMHTMAKFYTCKNLML